MINDEIILDDYDSCFRCKAHPPAPGGDACSGCRRFLAGYTDVDPKDTAPERSTLTDRQAEYILAFASARGFDVTRAELDELHANRSSQRFDFGDPRDRLRNDGWAIQAESGEWLTGDAGVAYLDEHGPSYA